MSTEKIRVQAYVEGALHEKFEQERISWGLNPSKAIEKILSERYAHESKPETQDSYLEILEGILRSVVDLDSRVKAIELQGELKSELKSELNSNLPGALASELPSELENRLKEKLLCELDSRLPSELDSKRQGELDCSMGLSQRDLAKRLRCSHSHISRSQKKGLLESVTKSLDRDHLSWELIEGKYYPKSLEVEKSTA